MKILVLSDSHREEEYLLSAVRREKPDAVIHLGDHASDALAIEREFPRLPVCRVRGNCDRFDTDVQDEALLQWEGVKILATHGHRYHVKSGLLNFCYAALQAGVQVALFGHTHIPYCEESEGLWLLNPGACGRLFPTYGIIEINNGTVLCRVMEEAL